MCVFTPVVSAAPQNVVEVAAKTAAPLRETVQGDTVVAPHDPITICSVLATAVPPGL